MIVSTKGGEDLPGIFPAKRKEGGRPNSVIRNREKRPCTPLKSASVDILRGEEILTRPKGGEGKIKGLKIRREKSDDSPIGGRTQLPGHAQQKKRGRARRQKGKKKGKVQGKSGVTVGEGKIFRQKGGTLKSFPK